MDFHDYLMKQLTLHPYMQPQDIIKLCYQSAFGAEHLLSDVNAAKIFFHAEYNSVPETNCILYEEISDSICRINLSAWKASGMPAEWLFHMFVNTVAVPQSEKDVFMQNLRAAEKLLQDIHIAFPFDEWNSYLNKYKDAGMPSVHHSQIYRDMEHPAYRIVNKRFLRLLPILQKASLLPDKTSANIIAIDGRAASGKSTIAEDLKLILDAGIIHMDDFFLPGELRTKERYAEPGGNVHYERFASEVIPFIKYQNEFSYRIFDCHKMDYCGTRNVCSSNWRVVEGAYSCHPILGDYMDMKVFSDIDPERQMERLTARNGTKLARRFQTEWIPLEEQYYSFYKIKEHADIIL